MYDGNLYYSICLQYVLFIVTVIIFIFSYLFYFMNWLYFFGHNGNLIEIMVPFFFCVGVIIIIFFLIGRTAEWTQKMDSLLWSNIFFFFFFFNEYIVTTEGGNN